MRKILFILIMLVSSAFVSSDSIPNGENILLTGTIITPKWYKPNGNLKFSLFHKDLKIEKLKLKGSVLIFSKDTVIPLSKIKKDSLTPISLSESVDKMLKINIDPTFSRYGGLIYVTIILSNGVEDKHTLLVLKETIKGKEAFRIYKKEKEGFYLLESVNIELTDEREIKKYSFE